MLLGRRLNHQSPRSTVSPSSRSWSASTKWPGDGLDHGLSGSDDLRVHLPRRGVALEWPAQLRERDVGHAERLEHHHRRDRPRVRTPVVAEVVVRGVLAAEDRVRLGHHLLDERVPDAGAHGLATVLPDHLGNGLGADQVVHDGATAAPGEHRLRDDRGRGRSADRLALVVDQEHPIGVAVERQPDVGARLQHALPQRDEVLGLDRVGGMVRERAVELAEEDLELEREPREDLRHHESTHPVRGVGHDLRAAGGTETSTKERTWAAKSAEEILLADLAALLGPLEQPGGDRVLDLGQPGGLPDRRGARLGRA